jgi:hypothetical protein
VADRLLHALAEAFDDLDRPLQIRMRHAPHDAAQRLLDTFGALVVIDLSASPCAERCNHKECRMSAAAVFEPNWISYRHSLVQVDKRRDADDETLEICAYCECEVDVDPAPHRPGCRGIGAPRASSATSVSAPIERKLPAAKPPVRPAPYVEPEGLDLLEAMDAGAPLTAGPDEDEIELDEEAAAERLGPDGDASSSSPELEEEEAAAVGDLAVSSTAVTPSAGELERAAAPSTPTAKRAPRPRGYWTIDRIVEGFKKHFELTGAAPTTTVLNGSKGPVPEYLPAWTNLRKVSTYDEILTRAGLERPQRASTRGTRSRRLAAESTTTRSEREPQAGDGALGPAAPPKVETPASTEPQATAPSSRSDIAGWIKVAGTGLAYRNSMEAYVAADEIEADGERVAQACRDDGNEERADLAIDQARELAEKIRAAARAADESGTTAGTTEREPQEARERPADAEPTSELPATQAPPTPVAPSRSALEPREAPPGSITVPTPLTRLLAKLPKEDLEQAVAEYRVAIARLHDELLIVDGAIATQEAA